MALLMQQPRSNADLYKYFLLEGYTITRVNPVLKELQNNNQIIVTLYGSDKAARRGSFYLNYKELAAAFPKVEIKLAA